jgi:hypothetical protein
LWRHEEKVGIEIAKIYGGVRFFPKFPSEILQQPNQDKMRKLRPNPIALFLCGSLAFIAFQFSCNSFKTVTDLDEQAKLIEMSKGPCFGQCPVFTLVIYQNGIAAYKGERFTDRMGLYVKRLPENQFRQIAQEFRQANLWQYQDVYRGQIPDLQTVTITYYEENKSKSVMGKDGRPDAVLKLEEMLDEIADSQGWEQKEKPASDFPDHLIPTELIVQLVNGVDAKAWARKFAKQNMQAVRSLSPNGYYWLFSYDDSLMAPKQMIEFVRQDPDVVSVEFNRK